MNKQNKFIKFWNYITYGGRPSSFYDKHASEIGKLNRNAMVKLGILCSIICSIIFLILLFLNIHTGLMPGLYWWYLGLMGLSCVMFLIPIVLKKVSNRFFNVFFYFIIIAFFVVSILLRFVSYQGQEAYEFYIFLTLIPLVFFDRPYRLFLISLTMACAFVTCGAFLLPQTNPGEPELILYLAINTISYFIIGQVMCIVFINLRLRDMEKTDLLVIQRDTDSLTNLPNRGSFNVYFENMESTDISAIAMFDIDFFKKYNDTYGHLYGDFVLNKIGSILLTISEENDIKIFRYGGEEFICLFKGKTKKEVDTICRKIVEAVFDLSIESNLSNHGCITISSGYSYNEQFKIHKLDLLKFADAALYNSKKNGGNISLNYKKSYSIKVE